MTLSTDTARFEGPSSLFYERHTSFYEKMMFYSTTTHFKINSTEAGTLVLSASMRGIGYTLPLVLLEKYQKMIGSNGDQTNQPKFGCWGAFLIRCNAWPSFWFQIFIMTCKLHILPTLCFCYSLAWKLVHVQQ